MISGHVRIYDWDGSTWTQLGDDIDGEAVNDKSGQTVSLSSDGRRVAIGAPYNDNDNGTDSGHVRIYNLPPQTTSQSGSGMGDPYITPIFGDLYKLPDRTAFYRLLKHNNTIINGAVVRFDEKYVIEKTVLFNEEHGNFSPNMFNFTSMYFFKNIYIAHNGQETCYNLLDQTFTNDCFDHIFTEQKVENCKIYSNTTSNACEIDLNGITIKLCTFDNPQIITGIELKTRINLENATGLLVYQQSSKPQMLKTIKSKKETHRIIKTGRKVEETFFNKTGSKTEKMNIEISVM